MSRKKSGKFLEQVPTKVSAGKKLFYTPEDAPSSYAESQGFPGLPPYTRGSAPSMYRGKRWDIVHYLRSPLPPSNLPLIALLRREGSSFMAIEPDIVSRNGMDPEDGSINDGISIFCLQDATLLSNALKDLPVIVDGGAALSQFVALFSSAGCEVIIPVFDPLLDSLNSHLPLSSLQCVEASLSAVHHSIEHGCPRLVVSTSRIAEVADMPEVEVAYAILASDFLLAELNKRGFSPPEVMRSLQVELGISTLLPEDIAKLRAFRFLWYKHFGRLYGDAVPHPVARGITRNLVGSQLENNPVRTTVQCLAAALGGAEVIAIPEATLPSGRIREEDIRLVMRTHAILSEEADIGHTADPVGGSYYIEARTQEICNRAASLVERLGAASLVRVLDYFWPFILGSRFEAMRRIRSKESIIVGVNMFRVEDGGTERQHVNRMKELKSYLKGQRYEFSGMLPPLGSGPELIEMLERLFERGATLGQATRLMARASVR